MLGCLREWRWCVLGWRVLGCLREWRWCVLGWRVLGCLREWRWCVLGWRVLGCLREWRWCVLGWRVLGCLREWRWCVLGCLREWRWCVLGWRVLGCLRRLLGLPRSVLLHRGEHGRGILTRHPQHPVVRRGRIRSDHHRHSHVGQRRQRQVGTLRRAHQRHLGRVAQRRYPAHHQPEAHVGRNRRGLVPRGDHLLGQGRAAHHQELAHAPTPARAASSSSSSARAFARSARSSGLVENS